MTIKVIIILSLFLFMFVMKMVFIRDQFKVGPRPDWSLLGPVSSKFYNERSLSFNNRVHSAPPCDLTKSLLVTLGLLEIGSFGFVKLPTRLVIPRKHPWYSWHKRGQF